MTPATVALHPAETSQLTAAALDQNGAPIACSPVTWTVSSATVARVSASGVVTAQDSGLAKVTATCTGHSGSADLAVSLAPVASVEVKPDSMLLSVGDTATMTATPRDANGAVALGWSVQWSSSDTTTARVSAKGLVTGVGAGSATVNATAGAVSGQRSLQVRKVPLDIAIASAIPTQGVQNSDGSIPIVLGGNGMVVNVWLVASRTTTTSMRVVLRLLNAGTLVRADTVTVFGAPTTMGGPDQPTAQIYVPASALSAGLTWEVIRDPNHLVADDSVQTDRFPRSGPAALATATVPPLKIRFIPIMLTAHGNVTGNVSAGNISSYLQTLLSVHPLSTIVTSVGPALSSAANFGTGSTGGAITFWQQVLSDVDAARLADAANSDAHWIGIVAPPPGFTFTSFGGIAYVPASYAGTGATTRSAALVNVGWFNNQIQTRNLVAHELGHNFGRSHAPCGGAGSPDPSFPFPDGTIGAAGFDVYSVGAGLTPSATVIPSSTGDVMGYCSPVWAGTYTYQAVLNFRGASLAAPPLSPIVPVLVVRGTVDSAGIALDPALVLTARASLPERPGPYTLEGIAADGTILFRYAFEPAVLDHSSARPFALAVPLTDQIDQDLEVLRVVGGGVTRTLTRSAGVAPAAAAAPAPERGADGMIRVSCASASARGIAVQVADGGTLLGAAPAAVIAVAVTRGTRLVVSCSDGVRSTRRALIAP